MSFLYFEPKKQKRKNNNIVYVYTVYICNIHYFKQTIPRNEIIAIDINVIRNIDYVFDNAIDSVYMFDLISIGNIIL